MSLRPPPGRAGRLWLRHRLEVASRSGDLLERRRQLLVEEERRLRAAAESSRRDWEVAFAEARLWLHRALASGGAQELRLAVAHLSQRAEVAIAWRSLMGVTVAEAADLALPEPRDIAAVGGTIALDLAVAAHASALQAAARHAAALQAESVVRADLAATSRRLRVIRDRRIPELDAAIAELDLRLDDQEREDHARSRWMRSDRGRSPVST